MNYYNENDPKAAAWLRELIKCDLISEGEVDERSICEVSPNDLTDFNQCHFFAGIGGWSLALRMADWPDDRPVWTGSCPCQPFSISGKRRGNKDERHLWPIFKDLIKFRSPSVVFGEQVASPLGREWFSGVRLDLEEIGYAVGGSDLCAAGVGAPHPRQRLFWVALNGVVLTDGTKWTTGQPATKSARYGGAVESASHSGGVGNPESEGRPGVEPERPCGKRQRSRTRGNEFWNNFEIISFRDGKFRRVEAGTFPLAHGVPGRVGLLRGYGNAIVPQVAAEFIQATADIFKCLE